MDLDLLRTFLELQEAGTMSMAAQRLFITQATVSSRIAQLEAQLGKRLFVRSKSGTQLTAEGRRLVPHVRQTLGAWQEAQRVMTESADPLASMSIGGEHTLSTSILLNWLVALRQDRSDVRLRAVVQAADELLQGVDSGDLDIVVLYSPLKRPRVKTKLVLREELICVSTHARASKPTARDYVYVDWGPDFKAQHEHAFSELSKSNTRIELGPLGLHYLLRVGGTGYFRTRAVSPYLEEKKLWRVKGMPSFSYSIYAAVSPHVQPELADWALQLLSRSAKEKVMNWA